MNVHQGKGMQKIHFLPASSEHIPKTMQGNGGFSENPPHWISEPNQVKIMDFGSPEHFLGFTEAFFTSEIGFPVPRECPPR